MYTVGGDVPAASQALIAAEPGSPLADGARFAEANWRGEAGQETVMWDQLAEIAGDDAATHPMARHAQALVESPGQNPYQAFEAAQGRETRKAAGFVALGPLQHGAHDRDLPRSVEWLLEAPSLMPVLGGIPWHLLQAAIAPPESRRPRSPLPPEALSRVITPPAARVARRSRSGRAALPARPCGRVESGGQSRRVADLAERPPSSRSTAARQDRATPLAILQATAERFPTRRPDRTPTISCAGDREAAEQKIRISRGF
jgi:hypothetical protein